MGGDREGKTGNLDRFSAHDVSIYGKHFTLWQALHGS